MRYLLMIFNNPEYMAAMTAEEQQRVFAEVDGIMAELRDSGELVGGEALADPSTARTVRVRSGNSAVTDGPFAESKEQLAGFLTVEVESVDRAVEIAARWPDAGYGAMEVRAIMDTSGLEM